MKNTYERIMAKTKKGDGCWLFTGRLMPNGYGQIRISAKDTNRRIGSHAPQEYVHRIAYQYHFGKIPDGLFVCHHCDVRNCVHPGHFFVGTASDNMQDMAQKGVRKGEKHALARLSEHDIFAIRQIYEAGFSQQMIADKYSISQTHVSNIVNGNRWGHIGAY